MNVCLNYKMLQYDRIDTFEGIDINKTDASKERIICHYQYFKDIFYKFESRACNGCHDLLKMACELKNIITLNVKGVDYRCVLWGVTKNEVINILGNSKLDYKGTL